MRGYTERIAERATKIPGDFEQIHCGMVLRAFLFRKNGEFRDTSSSWRYGNP